MERQPVIDLTDESDVPLHSSLLSQNHFIPDAAPIGVDICPDIIDLDRDIYSGESEIRHYHFDSHDLDLMKKRAAHGKTAGKMRSKTANNAATTLTSKATAEETSSKLTGKTISKGTGKAMSKPKEKGKGLRKARSKATSEVSSNKEAKSKAARNETNRPGGRKAQRKPEKQNQTLGQICKAARNSKETDASISIVPDNLPPHPFIMTREDTEQKKMGKKKDVANLKRTREDQDDDSKTTGKRKREGRRRRKKAVVLLGESSSLDNRVTDEQHTSYGVASMLTPCLDTSAHTANHVHPKQGSCGPDVASTCDPFPSANLGSYDKDQQNRRHAPHGSDRRPMAHRVCDRNRRVNSGDSDQRPFDMNTRQPPAGRGCFGPPIEQWRGHHRPNNDKDQQNRRHAPYRFDRRPMAHRIGDRNRRVNCGDYSDQRPFDMKTRQPPAGRGCFGPPIEQWRGAPRPNNRGRHQTNHGRDHPFHRAPGHPMGRSNNFRQFSGHFRPPPLSSLYEGVNTKLETTTIANPSLDRDGLSDGKKSEIRLAPPDQTDKPQKSGSPMYQSDDLVLDRDHRILSLEEEMEQAAWSNGLYAVQRDVDEEISVSKTAFDNNVSMIAVEERGEVDVVGDRPPVAGDPQESLKSEIGGVSIKVNGVTNDIAPVAERKDDTLGKAVSVAEGMRAEIRCKENQGSVLLTPEDDNTSVSKSRAGAVPEPTVFADVSPSALKPSQKDGDGKEVDGSEHNAASSSETAFVVMAESSDASEEEEKMLVLSSSAKKGTAASHAIFSSQCSSWLNSFFPFWKNDMVQSEDPDISIGSNNPERVPGASKNDADFDGVEIDNIIIAGPCDTVLQDGCSIVWREEAIADASPSAWKPSLKDVVESAGHEHNPASSSKTDFVTTVDSSDESEEEEMLIDLIKPKRLKPIKRGTTKRLFPSKNKSGKEGSADETQPPDQTGKNRTTLEAEVVTKTTCEIDVTNGQSSRVRGGSFASSVGRNITSAPNNDSTINCVQMNDILVVDYIASSCDTNVKDADSIGSRQAASVAPSVLKPSMPYVDGKEVDGPESNAASSSETAFVIMVESSDESEEEEADMLIHFMKPKRFKPIRRRKEKRLLSSKNKSGKKGTPGETKPSDQNETSETLLPSPSLVFGVARGNRPSSVSSSIPSSTSDKAKRAHSATAAVRQKYQYRRNRVGEEHSYNFSHEDALKEQERLFRESAARMRQQAQFRVESKNTVPYPTTFDAPVPDVAKRFPYHWQNHDMHARLGLHKGASFQLIKSHYRRLALVYHPDKSNDDSSAVKFQAITEAYRTLGGRYHI
jgi:hypothetical protein